MKKDLIIISAYTPDFKREELIRSFINQIDKTNYDLMVVSHSKLPDDLLNKVEYFIFDKENELLTDLDSKYNMTFGRENFRVHTTEARDFNHTIAAYKLFYIGINNARILGYKKVHIVEYDSTVQNMNLFDDNSKLLEDYSVVWFKRSNNKIPVVMSFPMSFNINKLKEDWFKWDKENILNSMGKTIEDWQLRQIMNQEDTYAKKDKITPDYIKNLPQGSFLVDDSLIINLYQSFGSEQWICPIIDENEELLMFVNNRSEDSLYYKVIVNGIFIKTKTTNPYNWSIVPLRKWEEVNTLSIIIDNKKLKEYNFEQMNRKDYKSRNSFTINQ
jgi:hypothetical protein